MDYAIYQILGGSTLHPMQVSHIVDELPDPPSPKQSLNANCRPVKVFVNYTLQPSLHFFIQDMPRAKAAPPALNGDCRLPAQVE